MQILDNEFFEAYKRLERLCSDIYGSRNGVSRYIEDMEHASYQGRLAVPMWDQSYKTLKHLRWIRNQIAHDSGQFQICGAYDIQDVTDFYDAILSGQDPLTQLRKHREASAAVKKTARRTEPVSTSPAAHRRNNPLSPPRIGRFFAAALFLIIVFAVIASLSFRFL